MVKTKFSPAILFVIVLSFYLGNGQTRTSDNIPAITYDELVRNKEVYIGKSVRLTATWIYGFEWTYLCSSECQGIDRAWVNVADIGELCSGSKRKLKRLGKKFNNRAEVTVQGILRQGGGYGHMGAYKLEFQVTCVERFKKIY
jgi:hypothetical protein